MLRSARIPLIMLNPRGESAGQPELDRCSHRVISVNRKYKIIPSIVNGASRRVLNPETTRNAMIVQLAVTAVPNWCTIVHINLRMVLC